MRDLVQITNEESVDSIISAGQLLQQLDGVPNKDTLKGTIADYIIDELVIKQVVNDYPDEMSKRAYAYYRMLYNKYRNLE